MPGMPHARSIPVLFGALALIPLGIVAAQVARRIIVEPVTQAMPDSLVRAMEDVVGGESGCASSNHATAKAFLERNEIGERAGARKVEHLYVIESDAGRRLGYEPWKYQASTVPVFE